MQVALFSEDHSVLTETIQPAIKPDNTYDLNGTLYLCLEMTKTGFGWFQKIDAQGNSIGEKKILLNSLNKLTKVI